MPASYGPVPSWRLGRSQGIDLRPGMGKTCTLDVGYVIFSPSGEPSLAANLGEAMGQVRGRR